MKGGIYTRITGSGQEFVYIALTTWVLL